MAISRGKLLAAMSAESLEEITGARRATIGPATESLMMLERLIHHFSLTLIPPKAGSASAKGANLPARSGE
jgi:hypothetical protein